MPKSSLSRCRRTTDDETLCRQAVRYENGSRAATGVVVVVVSDNIERLRERQRGRDREEQCVCVLLKKIFNLFKTKSKKRRMQPVNTRRYTCVITGTQ